MKILVMNCGSSSLKYQLIDMENEHVLTKGLCERIGIEGSVLTHKVPGKDNYVVETPMPDHSVAVKLVLDALTDKDHGVIASVEEINAIGHRVLHGGTKFTKSIVVNDDVKAAIRECFDLGPLHNPANLMGIEACEKVCPGKPNVAVFDPTFGMGMDEKSYLYAIPHEYFEKYGIRRYHQVSTDEVYGDLPLDRPDLFFTEETPIHTSSPYSASKASADLLVLAYHRTYGLPVTISRCSNNYGPYHFPEKLIPLMIANALNDKPLPVYGTGENVRDWLYVEDHCKAIDMILHNGRMGEVYNIGGHNEMRNIDIVKIICKALGKPESLITYVTDRKGHDMRYAIDPTKIHRELGWLPETKFADGIQKTIRWYLDNQDWWKTIISGEYQDYYEKMYKNR